MSPSKPSSGGGGTPCPATQACGWKAPEGRRAAAPSLGPLHAVAHIALTLGLLCARRPPTSLDSGTVPQRARFRPVSLAVHWPGGWQEETSSEGRTSEPAWGDPVCPLPGHNPASRLGGGGWD